MTALAQIDKARRALDIAVSVDDVKSIRDKAEALRVYAKQVGESAVVQNRCAEIRVRAERKAGGLLAKMEGKGSHGGRRSSDTVSLDALGIQRKQSERWQRIASISEAEFEDRISELRDFGEITSAAFLRMAKTSPGRNGNRNGHGAPSRATELSELAGYSFGCIYADPPWKYGNQGTRAATDNHYQTMSLDEIAALPVASLAADDAHLHLWTTNAFLFDAKRIIEAWGFTYKSCFVWVKPQMGIGNYWRVSHEFLLLGVRGSCSAADRSLMSWAEIPRSRHSRKPERVREMVERMSPGPRLEMFARVSSPGWTSWGNEVSETLLSLAAEAE